jgi:hypothetical protein
MQFSAALASMKMAFRLCRTALTAKKVTTLSCLRPEILEISLPAGSPRAQMHVDKALKKFAQGSG